MGGCAGVAAVAATGGALALAIGAALLGGAAGAGLGGIFAAAIARNHTDDVRQQIEHGGLVLWVNVPNADAEKRAVNVLNKLSARDVHVHEIQHDWGEAHARPIQADPFLIETERRS
ncbi:MAG: hypothetical protein ACRD2G_11475 [Terriglobia bacterium]